MHQVPIDRPLQVASAILQVSAFAQQIGLGFVGNLNYETGSARRVEYALLHQVQLDIKYLLQLWLAQWPKDHRFVDAVHEFGRELTSRCFYSSPRYFSGCFFAHLHRLSVARSRGCREPEVRMQ